MKMSVAERSRRYYAAHREEILARAKARRASAPEHARALEAARRKANPEAFAEKQRRWRQKPESKVKLAASQRKYRAEHLEAVRAVDRARYAKNAVRERAQRRVCYAKARLRGGKCYRPLFRMRLPAWAAANQRVLDVRSAYLDVNMTPAQRAYARELAIERKGK